MNDNHAEKLERAATMWHAKFSKVIAAKKMGLTKTAQQRSQWGYQPSYLLVSF
jgi:hypothetical protein